MRTLPVLVASLIAISAAVPAMAQDPPDRSRVEAAIGEHIRITTRDGRTQSGKLVITSPNLVTVVDDGRLHRIPWTEIGMIDHRRFRAVVGRSTLIGAGVGVGVGLAALATGGCTEDAGTFALECIAMFAGTGAGAGALTGLLIKVLRPPRIVYRGDRQRELRLAPVVVRNRAGIFGTIRW